MQIRSKKWRILGLTLPVLLPVVLLIVFIIFSVATTALSKHGYGHALGLVGVYIGVGGLVLADIVFFTGAPYVFFEIAMVIWARKKGADAVYAKRWLLPLLFCPFSLLWVILLNYLSAGVWMKSTIEFVWVLGMTLLYGYGFLLFFNAMTWIFRKKNWLV